MNSTVLGLHPELVSLTAFHKIPECLNFQILCFSKWFKLNAININQCVVVVVVVFYAVHLFKSRLPAAGHF